MFMWCNGDQIQCPLPVAAQSVASVMKLDVAANNFALSVDVSELFLGPNMVWNILVVVDVMLIDCKFEAHVLLLAASSDIGKFQ